MTVRRTAGRAAAVAATLALGATATADASVQARLETKAAASPTARVEAIVQFERTTSAGQRQALIASAGGRVTRELAIVNGVGVRISARGAALLGHQAGVRHVSENTAVRGTGRATVPTEDAPATSFLSSARVHKVWRDGATGEGVGIAVIDTGIAGDLADFRRSQRDGTSRVTTSVVTDPRATTATDRYGHGTHVAGIAAGNGSTLDLRDPLRDRYAGAAPEADLISVKASADDGSSTLMDVIAGLQFVVDHRDEYGIRVVNLSASATEAESYKLDPLDAAVESAWLNGIVVVAAAGNRGTAADAVGYAPGNDPYVISVGATDDRGTKNTNDDLTASWSSRGRTQDGVQKPDVLAPGAHIVAPLAPGSAFAELCATCVKGGGRYFQVSGTSMAAPVVAGIVADVLSAAPWLTPDQVKAAVVAGTRRTADGGRTIDAQSVLELAGSFGRKKDRLAPANQGLTPNPVVDAQTGAIDFEKISWGKISWGQASSDLTAPWAKISWGKISWGCTECDAPPDAVEPGPVAAVPTGAVEPDKISWGKISWGKISWGKLSWASFIGEDPEAELAGGSSGKHGRR